MNQDHSPIIFKDRNDTDGEKKKKEMIDIFFHTEFDTSSQTEVCPDYGCFCNPENVLNQPETHHSSLKNDSDDEFSSAKKDTLHVNYAHTTLFHLTR